MHECKGFLVNAMEAYGEKGGGTFTLVLNEVQSSG